MLDLAAASNQDADLSVNVATDLCQLSRKLLGEQPVGRNAAPEKALEPAEVAGLEAMGVAKDLNYRRLLECVGRQLTSCYQVQQLPGRVSSRWATRHTAPPGETVS